MPRICDTEVMSKITFPNADKEAEAIDLAVAGLVRRRDRLERDGAIDKGFGGLLSATSIPVISAMGGLLSKKGDMTIEAARRGAVRELAIAINNNREAYTLPDGTVLVRRVMNKQVDIVKRLNYTKDAETFAITIAVDGVRDILNYTADGVKLNTEKIAALAMATDESFRLTDAQIADLNTKMSEVKIEISAKAKELSSKLEGKLALVDGKIKILDDTVDDHYREIVAWMNKSEEERRIAANERNFQANIQGAKAAVSTLSAIAYLADSKELSRIASVADAGIQITEAFHMLQQPVAAGLGLMAVAHPYLMLISAGLQIFSLFKKKRRSNPNAVIARQLQAISQQVYNMHKAMNQQFFEVQKTLYEVSRQVVDSHNSLFSLLQYIIYEAGHSNNNLLQYLDSKFDDLENAVREGNLVMEGKIDELYHTPLRALVDTINAHESGGEDESFWEKSTFLDRKDNIEEWLRTRSMSAMGNGYYRASSTATELFADKQISSALMKSNLVYHRFAYLLAYLRKSVPEINHSENPFTPEEREALDSLESLPQKDMVNINMWLVSSAILIRHIGMTPDRLIASYSDIESQIEYYRSGGLQYLQFIEAIANLPTFITSLFDQYQQALEALQAFYRDEAFCYEYEHNPTKSFKFNLLKNMSEVFDGLELDIEDIVDREKLKSSAGAKDAIVKFLREAMGVTLDSRICFGAMLTNGKLSFGAPTDLTTVKKDYQKIGAWNDTGPMPYMRNARMASFFAAKSGRGHSMGAFPMGGGGFMGMLNPAIEAMYGKDPDYVKLKAGFNALTTTFSDAITVTMKFGDDTHSVYRVTETYKKTNELYHKKRSRPAKLVSLAGDCDESLNLRAITAAENSLKHYFSAFIQKQLSDLNSDATDVGRKHARLLDRIDAAYTLLGSFIKLLDNAAYLEIFTIEHPLVMSAEHIREQLRSCEKQGYDYAWHQLNRVANTLLNNFSEQRDSEHSIEKGLLTEIQRVECIHSHPVTNEVLVRLYELECLPELWHEHMHDRQMELPEEKLGKLGSVIPKSKYIKDKNGAKFSFNAVLKDDVIEAHKEKIKQFLDMSYLNIQVKLNKEKKKTKLIISNESMNQDLIIDKLSQSSKFITKMSYDTSDEPAVIGIWISDDSLPGIEHGIKLLSDHPLVTTNPKKPGKIMIQHTPERACTRLLSACMYFANTGKIPQNFVSLSDKKALMFGPERPDEGASTDVAPSSSDNCILI